MESLERFEEKNRVTQRTTEAAELRREVGAGREAGPGGATGTQRRDRLFSPDPLLLGLGLPASVFPAQLPPGSRAHVCADLLVTPSLRVPRAPQRCLLCPLKSPSPLCSSASHGPHSHTPSRRPSPSEATAATEVMDGRCCPSTPWVLRARGHGSVITFPACSGSWSGGGRRTGGLSRTGRWSGALEGSF